MLMYRFIGIEERLHPGNGVQRAGTQCLRATIVVVSHKGSFISGHKPVEKKLLHTQRQKIMAVFQLLVIK